jgi:hypothetical protein
LLKNRGAPFASKLAPADDQRFCGSELAREGSGADYKYSMVVSHKPVGIQATALLILIWAPR